MKAFLRSFFLEKSDLSRSINQNLNVRIRQKETEIGRKGKEKGEKVKNFHKSPLTYNIWKCYNVNGNQKSAETREKQD